MRHPRRSIVLVVLLVNGLILAPARPGDAQLGKRLIQIGACGGGALIGAKVGEGIGEKVAQFEATRRNLSPAEAERIKKGFQIGMALALCGGGAAIAGTTYSNLSKRGKEARERELKAALEDAQPRKYEDPEHPTMRGTITPQQAFMDGNKECRTVEDYLADGAQGDTALIRYCRPAAGGAWKVDNL
jgi:hypothetical protein